jgi:hypothetical protein
MIRSRKTSGGEIARLAAGEQLAKNSLEPEHAPAAPLRPKFGIVTKALLNTCKAK